VYVYSEFALFYTELSHGSLIWVIGSEDRRWDCHADGMIIGSPSGGSAPTDVRTWKYWAANDHWLYADHIQCRAGGSRSTYGSLQLAVGKEWAPAVAMTGIVGTLVVLTVVVVAAYRRRRSTVSTAERVPLAEPEEPTSTTAETEEVDDSSDEQEKLTSTV
jgi:hypothetical protein